MGMWKRSLNYQVYKSLFESSWSMSSISVKQYIKKIIYMKQINVIAICFLFAGSGLNQQVYAQNESSGKTEPHKLENPVSVEYLKKNLRKQSPRLVLNKKIEKNLKKKLKTDPVIQNVYKAIKLNAESVFEKPIINLDIPMEERSQNNQLDISRDLLHRISSAWRWSSRIEKDPRMLERINEEVIAACNFPSMVSQALSGCC